MPKHKQRRSTRTIKLDDPNVSYRIETDHGNITIYPTSTGPSLDIYVDAKQHEAKKTFLQIWQKDTRTGEAGHVGHVCGVEDQGIQVRLRDSGSLSLAEARDNPGLRKFYNRALGLDDDFMLDSEKSAIERAAEVGRMEDRTGDSPNGDEPKAIKAARMVESMLYATTTSEGKSLYAQAKAVLAAWDKQQQEGGAA
jgi:hypothetical protein